MGTRETLTARRRPSGVPTPSAGGAGGKAAAASRPRRLRGKPAEGPSPGSLCSRPSRPRWRGRAPRRSCCALAARAGVLGSSFCLCRGALAAAGPEAPEERPHTRVGRVETCGIDAHRNQVVKPY